MLEYVLGSVVILIVVADAILGTIRMNQLATKLNAEAELLQENLNHLAGAIISMSELLDDADEVIENISKVPTVGEMIQQALVGFITQKVAGNIPETIISPVQEVIKGNFVDEQHGEAKTQNNKKEKPQ